MILQPGMNFKFSGLYWIQGWKQTQGSHSQILMMGGGGGGTAEVHILYPKKSQLQK